MSEAKLLLKVENLKKHFPITRGVFKKVVGHVKAVDGVSFSMNSGETVGIVGESGCGKTTVARMIMGAYPPTEGNVWFQPPNGESMVDLAHIDPCRDAIVAKEYPDDFSGPFRIVEPTNDRKGDHRRASDREQSGQRPRVGRPCSRVGGTCRFAGCSTLIGILMLFQEVNGNGSASPVRLHCIRL